MKSLHFSLQLLCLLDITGFIITCGDHQHKINGICCNKCEPGFYLEEFCSDEKQTICKQCSPGFFSDNPSINDRCEECRSCDQEYSQKCTPTTDAKCSCGTGFLCSNNICSKCEKDKCVKGERVKRTAVVNNDTNLTEYMYECEPLCQNHEYYDEKVNVCRLHTLCSAHGLVELFAGNKTHNAICQSHVREMQKIYIVAIAGFVLFTVTIAVVFSYHLAKKLKRTTTFKAVKITTTDVCPLSMEETVGPIEDEHKEDSFG